jgi:hypothetical protein
MQHEERRRLVIGEMPWRHGVLTDDGALGYHQSDCARLG